MIDFSGILPSTHIAADGYNVSSSACWHQPLRSPCCGSNAFGSIPSDSAASGCWRSVCAPLSRLLTTLVPRSLAQSVPTPPQGTQTDPAFAASFKLSHVTNVFATTQKTSCYTPEVP